MRTVWGGYRFVCLVVASLIPTSSATPAQTEPTVRVNAVVEEGIVRLLARANAPFQYITYRPSDSLFVVDLTGVSAADPAGTQVVKSDIVSSYRIMDFETRRKAIVRLEVQMHTPVEPRLERRSGEELTLVFERPGTAVVAKPVAQPPVHPVIEGAAGPAVQVAETIEEVKLAQSGQQTQVLVEGRGPLTYHVLRLSQPERLVLDFEGARLRTAERRLPSNLDPVRLIRMAQFAPKVVRIVIDLRESAHFSISAKENQVTVAFAPTESSKGALKSLPAAATTHVMKTKASPAPSKPAQRQEGAQQIAAQPVALPTSLTQPSAALASPARSGAAMAQSNQKSITPSLSQGAATQPAFGPAPPGSPPTVASNQQPKPVLASVDKAASPSSSSKYTGEPISVNLKDVDLKDFFRLIHEISGLNVVLDPNVKGTLTIVLDDVPWDQALEIVLSNNGLDKQLEGNVLRIATKETLKKEAEQNRDLAKVQAEAVEVVTTTRVLSYAKAEDMASTLKKFLSPRGDILSDARSNTLIIRDIPPVLPVLDNLIRQLDRKSQQVEIEARVVAANRSFSREIGSQFAFATSATHGRNIFGGASGVGTSPIIRNSPPLPIPPLVTGGATGPAGGTTSSQLPLSTNLGAAAPSSGVSYAFSSPNFALDYIITAAESKGVGKLLSKPRVTTQNNTKATVKQGTKIPIQTIINNTISVQYIDAVLKLEVTPQITAEGTVFMDVVVENTQIDPAIPRVNGIPALDTQSAETKIIVNDGGTVVVGGVIISTQRTDIQQVPLFGSIPLIGNLFRRTAVSSQSQELLFFVTPRILPS